MRIFLDAGNDIYSLRTPGQTLARARLKAAHKLAQAERQRQSSSSLATKAAAKLQRQLAGEAARLAEEQEQPAAAVERAEEHERAVQPLIVNYFTPPLALRLVSLNRGGPPGPANRLGLPAAWAVNVGHRWYSRMRVLSVVASLTSSGNSARPAKTPYRAWQWRRGPRMKRQIRKSCYTQRYSYPSHAALLERYRHRMGDCLQEMFVRRCSKL